MNNNCTFVGHIGQTPHSVSFGDTGNKVVKFSVAVKEFSNKEDEDKTMWIDVDAWNGLGERVLKTVTKGREVVINGRLAMTTYTKEVNGVKVPTSKPVLKLTSFHLCGKKPKETHSEESDESRELAAAQR